MKIKTRLKNETSTWRYKKYYDFNWNRKEQEKKKDTKNNEFLVFSFMIENKKKNQNISQFDGVEQKKLSLCKHTKFNLLSFK